MRTTIVTLFDESRPFELECRTSIAPLSVAYETYGTLNEAGNNCILVCHALTGSAHAGGFATSDPKSAGWWEPMIGPGRALDTNRYFVVCSNLLGSCYGTTGPASPDPHTGRPYGMSFPQMTVRDMVRVEKALLDVLGVRSLASVLGGSLGGMQVLEWPLLYPERTRSIVPIATAVQHSPWCIGLDELGRQAIMNDADWRGGSYHDFGQPVRGLSLARQIAMMSYRSDISFLARFGRELLPATIPGTASGGDRRQLFQVESYLHYQGKKLVDRFDANTYIYITRAMDHHDVAAGRGDLSDVLSTIRIPVLCIGISSDLLYPVHEQKAIAEKIPGALYREIHSPHGHDAFLIEYSQLSSLVSGFLNRNGL